MKYEEKQKAIILRAEGKSLKEIAKVLKVSKSSVSLWVRQVLLTEDQKKDLLGRQTANACHTARISKGKALERRLQYIKSGFELASHDISFMILSALYWGEGAKSGNVLSISNSDPTMHKIVWKWLCNNNYLDKVAFSVYYYEENNISKEEICNWWKDNLPLLEDRHFRMRSCKISRASQRKHIDKLPYGTANTYVCNTELLWKVKGGIEYLKLGG